MKKPLVVIAGPTASGKSDTAINLAKIIGGEIISADSMQVYKELNIGTAKITEDEKAGIPHHLLRPSQHKKGGTDLPCDKSLFQKVLKAHHLPA